MVRASHVDMNGHVNNVHYLTWMLEDVPDALLATHELTEINIEFRNEAHAGDMVEALGSSEELGGGGGGNGNGSGSSSALRPQLWTHMLRRPPTWDGKEEEEIVRATSLWVPRAGL